MKSNIGYVDSFVLPVPRKNLKKYLKWAKLAGKVWCEHGALNYFEAKADDVPKGDVTSFGKSVKQKSGEIVVVAYATYRSKSDRDRTMKKVMADPRLQSQMDPKNWPFDGMRMFWGGFKPIVKY